jgi:hypothetical protein
MRCTTCGDEVKEDCDWRQGRCPHRTPLLTDYHFRYVNLWQSIKNWFNKGECDCGHKH